MEQPAGFQNSLICPYNKAHVILKDRMQFHLTKCRKNYPEAEKVQCPFNQTHIVNKLELEFHRDTCPERTVLDRFMYGVGETECVASALIPVNAVEMPKSNEDWDAEENTVSILDKIKEDANDKPMLRYLPGTTKSKRKNFRQQERLRHNNIEQGPVKLEHGPTGANEKPPRPILREPQLDPEFNRIRLAEIESTMTGIGRGRGILKPLKSDSNVSRLYNDMKKLNLHSMTNKADEPSTSGSTESVKEVDVMSSGDETMFKKMDYRDSESKLTQSFSFLTSEEGFCQLPIPGVGRGKKKNK